MAGQGKLSVEEILAACRSADGAGGAESLQADSSPAEAPVGSGVREPSAAEESPSAAKPAPKAGKMSVADMLAAARSGKAGGTASAEPVEAKPPAVPAGKSPAKLSVAEMLAAARSGGKSAAPAEKAPVAKKAPANKPAATAKPVAGKVETGPKDTASILAMARKGHKPGPVSKAEAVAAGQAVAPRSKMPEMPSRPVVSAPVVAEDRRSFFATFVGSFLGSSLAVGFSSLAVTQILWVLGMARFMFPNILTEPPTIFKVGFPDAYGPGQVQAKYKAQFGVWVVSAEIEGQSQIYALKSVCTHLGCTPNWLEGEQKFKCPCHGSGFYKDGVNFEGPAPRPLERYAIRRADDGQLEVDKSRTFQEELGQWLDAASFVSV
jgi:cytochrome b6-f complex iron-sulfur subunit